MPQAFRLLPIISRLYSIISSRSNERKPENSALSARRRHRQHSFPAICEFRQSYDLGAFVRSGCGVRAISPSRSILASVLASVALLYFKLVQKLFLRQPVFLPKVRAERKLPEREKPSVDARFLQRS